ncbi:MAG: apolipoprotein N-acyltransferase [Acidobacteriota bacterium]|nr:apolipoprotein N-acyltransferase [Acidobacteriota bacterium]
MKFSAAKSKLPSLKNALLAIVSAILLIGAFPDFDFRFLAWFALVPLFFAIEREKESIVKSFVLGWIFGIIFFFGSCWWLTFAPITYGGVPSFIAYLLFFGVTLVTGFFPAIFGALFSLLLKRFGSYAILSAPFLWTATEFLRFWMTGNNWNAIGYSQAFYNGNTGILKYAAIGGIYLVGFICVFFSSCYAVALISRTKRNFWFAVIPQLIILISLFYSPDYYGNLNFNVNKSDSATIIAVQPNVPMSGLKYGELENLRTRHVELAENALQKIKEQRINDEGQSTIIIFPESPMNFEYESDREFQSFLKDFTARNNASVLFNSAQPNTRGTNLYNSAVMVNALGEKIAQYDKIHLVPFGETVPLPDAIAQFVPTMVGNFEVGNNYNLFPVGDAKGGVMICFESHFPELSREFVRGGADVLIEMTNDGYLGKTPVLRQHLANAVFRAVETNRPVVRVTNTGITAYINERGEVLDALDDYTQGARVWTISKSDGEQTFYVKYGDWFAWLCSIASLALLFWSFRKRENSRSNSQETQKNL